MKLKKFKSHSVLSLSLLSVVFQTHGQQIMPKDATAFTAQANKSFIQQLPTNETQDFTDASRGLIETIPELVIKNDKGLTVWDMTSYSIFKTNKLLIR